MSSFVRFFWHNLMDFQLLLPKLPIMSALIMKAAMPALRRLILSVTVPSLVHSKEFKR